MVLDLLVKRSKAQIVTGNEGITSYLPHSWHPMEIFIATDVPAVNEGYLSRHLSMINVNNPFQVYRKSPMRPNR